MDNNFDKSFSNLQAEMVSVCLEYCERKCDNIFIHLICENNTIFLNFFYRIDGIMRRKSKLNDSEGLVNPNRQKEALSTLTNKARDIILLFEKNHQQMPTEFKIIYDAVKGGMTAEYNYTPVTTAERTDRIASEEWFKQEVSREKLP